MISRLMHGLASIVRFSQGPTGIAARHSRGRRLSGINPSTHSRTFEPVTNAHTFVAIIHHTMGGFSKARILAKQVSCPDLFLRD